jgi:hypothetical protein
MGSHKNVTQRAELLLAHDKFANRHERWPFRGSPSNHPGCERIMRQTSHHRDTEAQRIQKQDRGARIPVSIKALPES